MLLDRNVLQKADIYDNSINNTQKNPDDKIALRGHFNEVYCSATTEVNNSLDIKKSDIPSISHMINSDQYEKFSEESPITPHSRNSRGSDFTRIEMLKIDELSAIDKSRQLSP